MVSAWIGLGLGVWRLEAAPMLLGFVIGLLVWMAATAGSLLWKTEDTL